MRTPRPSRAAIALAAILAALLATPAALGAHAVVYPKASAAGAYERYVLRVPNEKDVATTRVEIRFPADVRVTSFGDVAGWTLETLTDSAGRIVGATWTGTLPSKRFVELPFIAVNPRAAARLVWPAFQTYADGERVEWTGPAGSRTPASATDVAAPADTTAAASAASASAPAPIALYVGGAALLLSLVSLGLALRRPAA